MNKLTTCLIFVFLTFFSFGQPGTIDNTFNVGDGTDSLVQASDIQSNGKIIIGGLFNNYDGQPANNLARLNSDGTLDQSFSIGLGPDDAVFCIAVQSDGKIIIGGKFSTFNGVASNNIARLNPDGTIDQTFNSGAYPIGPGDEVHAITIQDDGKLLIGGMFSTYDNISSKGIARVDADGDLDPTFDPGSGIEHSNYAQIFEIELQNDGQILIGGEFDSYNGTNRRGIARLNPDGSLDPTFDPGIGIYASSTNYFIRGIEVRQDGKILIGGSFIYYNGELADNLTLLNTDGTSADPNNEIETFGKVYSLETQSDYKVIVGGALTSVNGNSSPSFIARLNEDLTLDETFESAINLYVYTVSLQSDGKIIVGGQPWNYPYTETRVHRLNGGEVNNLNEDILESEIKVYPNPAKNNFNIELTPALMASNFKIQLFSISGKKVEGISFVITGKNSVKVDNLNSGLYLLKIIHDNGDKVVRKVSIID